MIEAAQFIAAALGWLSGVVGAMLAVRGELRWLRADVDRAHARLDWIEKHRKETT